MKAKTQLLLKKMKSSPDISWNEKGELKYKGETVQGSNVVDLVNPVSREQVRLPRVWVCNRRNRVNDWSYSLRRSSADRSSLSSMVCIFLSKVSLK
jgi:hypothetical protein